MFKLNCSAQDVAGRYHNICIIGVFDHPVTRGHHRQKNILFTDKRLIANNRLIIMTACIITKSSVV